MENSFSLEVKNRYMVVPADTKGEYKSIVFSENGKIVFDTKVKIAEGKSDFTCYIDIERFKGKTLEVHTIPEGNLPYTLADEDDFAEKRATEPRPFYHFCPPRGWLNDPNGLSFYNGKYQLFYQFIPGDSAFNNNNMNWGHAESVDLFSWKDLPIALHPDDAGSMYSGSGYVDKKNVSGLHKNGKAPLLLYYTASGGRTLASGDKKYSQNIAISYDGVKFEKYDKNPIITEVERCNRDPKVFYIPEVGFYGMIFFLIDHSFALYKSDDLLNWNFWQRISLENDSECPDFLHAKIENEYKWVFMAAHDGFAVGHFELDGFHKETEKLPPVQPDAYAPQSFSGLGDRIVRIYWERMPIPSTSCTQQLSVPFDTEFEKINGEYYIRHTPVKEIAELYENGIEKKNFVVRGEEVIPLSSFANDISIDFEFKENEKVNFNIFGSNIVANMENNTLDTPRGSIPLTINRNKVNIRLLTDRCSVECLTDNGHFFTVFSVKADNKNEMKITSENEIKINGIEIHSIKNVY